MPIIDRFKPKPIIEEEDEYGREVELFEKYELSVFLKIVGIYADAEECFAALHLMTMYDRRYRGRTPSEIAYDLYNNWLDGREEKVARMLERIYDTYYIRSRAAV